MYFWRQEKNLALTFIPKYAVSDLAYQFLDTCVLSLFTEFLVSDSLMCGRYSTPVIVLHITCICFIHDL